MIMNKQCHTNVKYTSDTGEACMMINDPKFKKMSEIEGLYEIEAEKRDTQIDHSAGSQSSSTVEQLGTGQVPEGQVNSSSSKPAGLAEENSFYEIIAG